MTQKLSESENSLKEKSRSYILIQGEIEQEKSVMTLKSQQMEFNLEEGKKKIRLLEENLQNINGKVSEDFREMSFRYESTIKTLQTNVTELTDKVHEYEVDDYFLLVADFLIFSINLQFENTSRPTLKKIKKRLKLTLKVRFKRQTKP